PRSLPDRGCLLRRPALSAVQHPQDLHVVLAQAVGDDIRGSRDHQLPRVRDTTEAPALWKLRKRVDGIEYALRNNCSAAGVIPGDVGAEAFEVVKRGWVPYDTHRGRVSSSSVPQLRSQEATRE